MEEDDETCLARIPASSSALIEETAVILAKERFGESLALVERVPNAQKASVRFRVAEAGLDAGNSAEALPVLEQIVASDPQATSSARLVVRELTKSNPAEAEKFCSGLLQQKRVTQALGCLDSRVVSEETRWGIIAAQPSLSAADLSAFAANIQGTKAASVRASVAYCESKKPLHVEWDAPTKVDGLSLESGTDRVFHLLAENAPDDEVRGCLIALSAAACVRSIQERQPCTSPSSLASYTRIAKNELRGSMLLSPNRFVGALYESKAVAYADARTPDAKRTLIQLHLALAEIFRERPDPLNHDWKWHLERAKDFWRKLYGSATPFPKDIEAQISRTKAP